MPKLRAQPEHHVRFSQEALARLQRTLPNCEIIVDGRICQSDDSL